MEKTGCEIICGAPTTLAVEGQMMMIMKKKKEGEEEEEEEEEDFVLKDRVNFISNYVCRRMRQSLCFGCYDSSEVYHLIQLDRHSSWKKCLQ